MVFSISHIRGRLGHLRVLKADSCRSRISNQMPEDLNERKSTSRHIDTLQTPSGRSSKSTVLTQTGCREDQGHRGAPLAQCRES